ncbi:hypothetical protein Agub_g11529, partial [Astrephomene gubernaculifera]
MRLTIVSMLFLLVPLLLPTACAIADSRHTAKLLLAEEIANSPPDRDVYAHVPKVQRHLWEHDDGRSINETLQHFSDIPVDVVVAVKLIAFDGDGINRARLSDAELLRHLRSLQLDSLLPTAVLEPQETHLSVRPRVHFRVTKAPPSLTQKLAGVLLSAVFEGKRASLSPHGTLYLPHTLVNDVLVEEERAAAAAAHASSSSSTAPSGTTTTATTSTDSSTTSSSSTAAAAPLFTLYVLNLEPPSGTDYLYTYWEAPELVAAGNWSEFRSCPGAVFVSPSSTSASSSS